LIARFRVAQAQNPTTGSPGFGSHRPKTRQPAPSGVLPYAPDLSDSRLTNRGSQRGRHPTTSESLAVRPAYQSRGFPTGISSRIRIPSTTSTG
jgi:hypothetical protein